MEVGALRCGCSLSVALPPRGCARVPHDSAPFASLSTSSSSPCRSAPFWRPWALGPAMVRSPCGLAESSGKLAQYAHPVRLFWPKSRCYDYLYQEAEALLKNFPVQATISFYEDTDSEEDEGELEQDARAESHC
ncbi:protein ripply2 isoform X2 [Phasianus colchicus]|uniref:Ripply transcriptional repressor 2 n=1 Tax=Phasianus colchicus TaxID=9054 RepID=A0A669QGU6_PHACC|nr:protein ripply2 isoform X2 [Phasianus colchicus]